MALKRWGGTEGYRTRSYEESGLFIAALFLTATKSFNKLTCTTENFLTMLDDVHEAMQIQKMSQLLLTEIEKLKLYVNWHGYKNFPRNGLVKNKFTSLFKTILYTRFDRQCHINPSVSKVIVGIALHRISATIRLISHQQCGCRIELLGSLL